jgi:hypothetical protein
MRLNECRSIRERAKGDKKKPKNLPARVIETQSNQQTRYIHKIPMNKPLKLSPSPKLDFTALQTPTPTETFHQFDYKKGHQPR